MTTLSLTISKPFADNCQIALVARSAWHRLDKLPICRYGCRNTSGLMAPRTFYEDRLPSVFEASGCSLLGDLVADLKTRPDTKSIDCPSNWGARPSPKSVNLKVFYWFVQAFPHLGPLQRRKDALLIKLLWTFWPLFMRCLCRSRANAQSPVCEIGLCCSFSFKGKSC